MGVGLQFPEWEAGHKGSVDIPFSQRVLQSTS
jgi:hypothetical protein